MCASYPDFTGRLPCSVDGYPVPAVSAMAQGVTQLNNVDLTTSPVTITNVVEENAGNYTCTATNTEGEVSRSVLFFIGGQLTYLFRKGSLRQGEVSVARKVQVPSNQVSVV